MLCGWKAGGGGPGRRAREEEEGMAGAWRIGCPRDGARETGREGGGCLVPEFAGGSGAAPPAVQSSFSDSGPGPRAAGLKGCGFSRGSASRVKGGGKGRWRPSLFIERSRAGGERRSPLSFSFPFSLSLFKVTFAPRALWAP